MSNYLFEVMYENAVYLIKEEPNIDEIYPIERGYLDDIISYLSEIKEGINNLKKVVKADSWKATDPDGLVKINTATNLIEIYEKIRKENIYSSFNFPKNYERFFSKIYDNLKGYSKGNPFPKRDKKIMKRFFERLESEYMTYHTFESCDDSFSNAFNF